MAVVKGLDDGSIFVILGVVMELSSILETFVISFVEKVFFHPPVYDVKEFLFFHLHYTPAQSLNISLSVLGIILLC